MGLFRRSPPKPLRVLHLEMPRAFTTTLRMFDFRNAAELDSHSINFDQADLNTHFWQFALDSVAPGLGFEDFFDPGCLDELLVEFCRFFDDFFEKYSVPLSPLGFVLEEMIPSTGHIAAAAQLPEFQLFVDEYVDELIPGLKIDDPELEVVSLGVVSAGSLVFACLFAEALRDHLPAGVKLILGKHSYENFSLSLRKAELIHGGHLDKYFDRVVYHEEMLVPELLDLAGRDFTERVEPESLSAARALEVLRESVFLDHLGLPLSRFVCSMPLSRNRCYWNKCTFCVQVKKHLDGFAYQEPYELESAISELEALEACGFRYFLFNDEAVQPARLRKFCDLLEDRNLDIRWTPRIIADANFKEELIERMAGNGCFEVLFGLETVSATTAETMKKVSHRYSEEQLLEMFGRFNRNGINIFLNLIYAFPTESDEEFDKTYRFSQRLKQQVPNISLQFNKFALFYGTDIYDSPDEFGVRLLEEAVPGNDLKIVFPYEDRFGRSNKTPPNMTYYSASLGMKESTLSTLHENRGSDFIDALCHVNYASFGLINKDVTGKNLFSRITQEQN